MLAAVVRLVVLVTSWPLQLLPVWSELPTRRMVGGCWLMKVLVVAGGLVLVKLAGVCRKIGLLWEVGSILLMAVVLVTL